MQVTRKKVQEIVLTMDLIERNAKFNDKLTLRFFINRRLMRTTYEDVEAWIKKLKENYLATKKIKEQDLMADTKEAQKLRDDFEKYIEKNKEHNAYMDEKVEIDFQKMEAADVEGSNFNTGLMATIDQYLFN